MTIKQISVFVENKPGKLAQLIRILADANIDLRALSVADTDSFGILRLIVDDTKKAKETLTQSGYTVSDTDVIAVAVPDSCGSLSKVLDIIKKENINIEYMYAYFSNVKDDNHAYMIFRVQNNEKTADILSKNGYKVVSAKDLGLR